jgi:predicted nucleic acid-binding protein
VVLVDTSVWIRFFAGTEPYASELDQLLSNEDVLAHDFVFGELLIGDRGGRGQFLVTYSKLRHAAPLAHLEVADFVRHRRIYGRGIGWLDAHLLASAITEHSTLWTADRSLAAIAQGIGVAYSGTSV